MNQRKKGKMPAETAKARAGSRRGLISGLVIAASVALAVAAWLVYRGGQSADPKPAAEETGGSAVAGTEMLRGRWLRPDGDYILEIRGIDSNGNMDCGYYNPQPIHVSRASAKREGTTTQVFVELRDTGYPGCTYDLTYDPREDILVGTYYQAALRQTYEIFFARMK